MSEVTSDGSQLVMVVDDDAVNLLLASEVLNLFGVQHVTWTNGDDALRDFEARSFSLVFMDVHMPGISGLELTDRMRAAERSSGRDRTPIVALTASAMAGEQVECLRRDMDAVLAKPFAFEAMREMLTRWSVATR